MMSPSGSTGVTPSDSTGGTTSSGTESGNMTAPGASTSSYGTTRDDGFNWGWLGLLGLAGLVGLRRPNNEVVDRYEPTTTTTRSDMR